MPDLEETNRIEPFLEAPPGSASADETAAWDDFVRTHDPMVRDVVRKYAHRWADCDDLRQEVWKALARELPGFHLDPARGTLRGWIATVAHRAAGRAAGRMSRRRMEVLTPDLTAVLLDPAPDPATLFERMLDQSLVQAILADPGSRIPGVSQRIVVMRYFEDRSVPQIGGELGLSEHCVEMRLNRALKKLRGLFCERGFGTG